jgi:hypothetical protein
MVGLDVFREFKRNLTIARRPATPALCPSKIVADFWKQFVYAPSENTNGFIPRPDQPGRAAHNSLDTSPRSVGGGCEFTSYIVLIY